MNELEELKLAYAECSRQRNELLNKLKSHAQQEPVAYAVYHRMGGSKTLHWPEQHSEDGDHNEYRLVPLYAELVRADSIADALEHEREECIRIMFDYCYSDVECEEAATLIRARRNK